MALIAHQTQGSYATFSGRLLSGDKTLKLKAFASFQLTGRTDRCISLRRKLRNFALSVQRQRILSSKGKLCKISSFKGNAQNDESESRTNDSKFNKNSVQLSYAPQETEVMMTESSDVEKVPLSYVSEEIEEKTMARSPVIQQLFKKWLMMLQTPTSSQPTGEIFKEGPSQTEILEDQHGTVQQGATGQLMKAALGYFLRLDAAVKLPPIIFIPWYLVINIVYGAEVSKELMPLWVLGPMIVAIYIKLIQGLCALYVFSIKQTIGLVKNLPTYYLLTYNYVAEGKLNEFLRVHLWKPVADIGSLDYKELSKGKLKELEVWAVEKYLDYIESIWPYYCRTIRFLKKANLI